MFTPASRPVALIRNRNIVVRSANGSTTRFQTQRFSFLISWNIRSQRKHGEEQRRGHVAGQLPNDRERGNCWRQLTAALPRLHSFDIWRVSICRSVSRRGARLSRSTLFLLRSSCEEEKDGRGREKRRRIKKRGRTERFREGIRDPLSTTGFQDARSQP